MEDIMEEIKNYTEEEIATMKKELAELSLSMKESNLKKREFTNKLDLQNTFIPSPYNTKQKVLYCMSEKNIQYSTCIVNRKLLIFLYRIKIILHIKKNIMLK